MRAGPGRARVDVLLALGEPQGHHDLRGVQFQLAAPMATGSAVAGPPGCADDAFDALHADPRGVQERGGRFGGEVRTGGLGRGGQQDSDWPEASLGRAFVAQMAASFCGLAAVGEERGGPGDRKGAEDDAYQGNGAGQGVEGGAWMVTDETPPPGRLVAEVLEAIHTVKAAHQRITEFGTSGDGAGRSGSTWGSTSLTGSSTRRASRVANR